MLKRLSIFVFLLSFGRGTAQTIPQVSLQADTLAIRMGEQIGLNVQVQADTLSFVDYPDMKELGDFEVVETSKIDTLQAKPFQSLLKKYFITAWDTGKYTVPPILIKIQDSVFKTDSLQVQVLPVAVDTTQQDLYGFKPLLNINGKPAKDMAPKTSAWWWLLLLLPLFVLGWYLFKRRQKQILAQQKVLSPYEKAIKNLQDLYNQKLWLKDKVDIHYFKLTEIFKDYLENELHLSVKEKLSFQIIDILQKYRFETGKYFPNELIEKLKQSFQRADLAKFAKLVPEHQEIEFDFEIIKEVIEFSHEIVQQIADEKAAEVARLKAIKKKRRKTLTIIISSIVLLLLLLGGTTYYFLNKAGYLDNISENIAKPEWLYSEYGATPSVGLTTPHILKPVDVLSKFDEKQNEKMTQLLDEISAYADENPIKGYFIVEMNMDIKQNLSKQVSIPEEALINLMLTGLKAKNVVMNTDKLEDGKRFYGSFDLTIPKLNITRTFEYDTHIYNMENVIRMVMTAYNQGNEENKKNMERVMNSIQLIQEN